MLDRGHEDRGRGEDLLLIVSCAPEGSRVPPVDRLNDVLRIRFCHLRTRRGDGGAGGGVPCGFWNTTIRSFPVSTCST